MNVEFFQTLMGKTFYMHTAPKIAKELENIANELKRANDLKERELEQLADK